MLALRTDLLERIRERFAHVEECPFEGPRVFFENAGGALTLESVVETSARLAAIPDNQGRDNAASAELMRLIERGRDDARLFLGASGGRVLVGESGTELLFRLIRDASLGTARDGRVLGSTLEHPASRSAAARWAPIGGKRHVLVAHDDATGSVEPVAYAAAVTPDTRVATIIHASPVTGMTVDVAGIARAIRAVAPECLIVIDGIQRAAHGPLHVDACAVDGYVISPYKAFSRHGYGLAWISDRFAALPHDALLDAPAEQWELGTRDTAAYATFSEVVAYLEWLGGELGEGGDRRARLEAAGRAIHAHEARLCETMLAGEGNFVGLAALPGVTIIGGADNPRRAGLVAFRIDGVDSVEVVGRLRERGVRVHVRKDDHYSGNVLRPLGLASCVRVSLCHYNSEREVLRFLGAMQEIRAGES